MKQPVNIVLQR